MGKPPGISMSLSGGTIHMGVTRSSRAEDKIWEAVEEAILEGWQPKQFIEEVRSAWAEARKDMAKADDDQFAKEF